MNAVAAGMSTPCVVTTLTTAAAFLSFTISDLDTFYRLGTLSASGVVSCLILTFTLLPILTVRVRTRPRQEQVSEAWIILTRSILAYSERGPHQIFTATAVVVAICAYGWATHLRVDNDWSEMFGEDSNLTQSLRFLEGRLGPPRSVELGLWIPEGASVADPRTLSVVRNVADTLAESPAIGRTRSVVDLIQHLNRLVHDDDLNYERIGETHLANAELIELLGFQDPDTLSPWLSFDRKVVRVSAEATAMPYQEKSALMEQIRNSVKKAVPSEWDIAFSGFAMIDDDWIKDVQATQARSFPTALVLVVVILTIALRAPILAIAAIVPTIFPVIIVLGTMGWVGLNLDVGRAMIAAVLIGISVDDAVHILLRYKQRLDLGSGPRDAIRHAVRVTGRAVVTTSVALSLGFLTLMASAWQSISSFGLSIAATIVAALAASLLVLPALVFAFNPTEEQAPT